MSNYVKDKSLTSSRTGYSQSSDPFGEGYFDDELVKRLNETGGLIPIIEMFKGDLQNISRDSLLSVLKATHVLVQLSEELCGLGIEDEFEDQSIMTTSRSIIAKGAMGDFYKMYGMAACSEDLLSELIHSVRWGYTASNESEVRRDRNELIGLLLAKNDLSNSLLWDIAISAPRKVDRRRAAKRLRGTEYDTFNETMETINTFAESRGIEYKNFLCTDPLDIN